MILSGPRANNPNLQGLKERPTRSEMDDEIPFVY
jgi:hypothetical protein